MPLQTKHLYVTMIAWSANILTRIAGRGLTCAAGTVGRGGKAAGRGEGAAGLHAHK